MLYALIIISRNKAVVNKILYIAILLSFISMYSFRDHMYEDANKSGLLTLIDKLEAKNVHHAYVNGGLLQWQLMFYSKERIIARYHPPTDRYPRYIKLVDDALNSTSTKVSMVGFFNPNDTSMSPYIIPVEGQYYIYENPDEIVLKKYGFVFKKHDNNK